MLAIKGCVGGEYVLGRYRLGSIIMMCMMIDANFLEDCEVRRAVRQVSDCESFS